ncbi:MAG: hypothetical protein KDB53_07250, partial [Planctomycetes bacterium]|nr:hypothetical protein [Planctomycetota bacterium]
AVYAPYAWSWNGSTWQALPGLDGAPLDFGLTSVNGSPRIVATGDDCSGTLMWDGQTWQGLGSNPPHGRRLLTTSQGELFAASAKEVHHLDGNTWMALGTGVTQPVSSRGLSALSEALPGNGDIVAGGTVPGIGGVPGALARWNGTAWTSLPDSSTRGAPFLPWDVVSYESDGQRHLYSADQSVWRLEGDRWHELPGGPSEQVWNLEVFDDGSGHALYAALLDGDAVWRFDGTTWTTIPLPPQVRIRKLRCLGPGTGAQLYAAGGIALPTGGWQSGLWTLQGMTWQPVGNPVPAFDPARDVARHDDGTGSRLYLLADRLQELVGTTWHEPSIPGIPPNYLASGHLLETSDGSLWFATIDQSRSLIRLNGGVATVESLGDNTYGLQEFDLGDGPELVILVGQDQIRRRALAASASVQPYASFGSSGHATQIRRMDDEGLPSLFVMGPFSGLDGVASHRLAELTRSRPRLTLTAGAGSLTVDILATNPASELVTIFSVETPGSAGSGPYAGLFATDPSALVGQVNLPLGVEPFHVHASPGVRRLGPYSGLPTGVTIDALTIEVHGGEATVSFVDRVALP